MICAHCKSRDVNVAHVKACSTHEQGIRSVGSRRTIEDVLSEKGKGGAASGAIVVPLSVEPKEGVYFNVAKEAYFKVQQGVATGNFYAKEWVGGEWEYRGRAPLHYLSAADKVSATDAARFGHVTGQCVFCSRKLTDERSIAVGYGPTCADREGLPWG